MKAMYCDSGTSSGTRTRTLRPSFSGCETPGYKPLIASEMRTRFP